MSEILNQLRREHADVAQLLRLVDKELGVFDEAGEPDYDLVLGVLDYCAEYPDRFHHPKEDLIYQKLLLRDPQAAEAVGDLEHEHRELAKLTAHFREAVDNVLNEAEIPRETVDHVARNFLGFYRSHIEKEDRLFFPAAERVLADEDWAEIDSHLHSPEDPLFGGETPAHLARLRESLLHRES